MAFPQALGNHDVSLLNYEFTTSFAQITIFCRSQSRVTHLGCHGWNMERRMAGSSGIIDPGLPQGSVLKSKEDATFNRIMNAVEISELP